MNQPTPDPSKEGSKTADARRQFPSWEGSGVGSWPDARPKIEVEATYET